MKKNSKDNTQNGFTMVKTGYARAAILLLAFNFCLTAYAFMRLNNYVDERLDGQAGVNNTEKAEVIKQAKD